MANIEHFLDIDERKFDEDEFILLKQINCGDSGLISLNYHFDSEQLFAIKKQKTNDSQFIKREIGNCKHLHHPLFPRFYGTIESNEKISIIYEFIKGSTLADIKGLNLKFNHRVQIISELLHCFDYLHKYKFIYRDLKQNNVIIDENNQVVLIDFEQMIIETREDIEYTNKWNSEFVSPELSEYGMIQTSKADIYSIGKMIYYILLEKVPPNEAEKSHNEINSNIFSEMFSIYNQCNQKDPDKRPNITELIQKFNHYAFYFFYKIQISTSKN